MKISTSYGAKGYSFKLFGILKQQHSEYSQSHVFSLYAGHELWPAYKVFGYGIYLHPTLQKIATLPERAWRYVLCRLWLDRLTFQYEAGYAAGLKDGLANAHAHDGLTPEEREALTS